MIIHEETHIMKTRTSCHFLSFLCMRVGFYIGVDLGAKKKQMISLIYKPMSKGVGFSFQKIHRSFILFRASVL